MFGFKPGTYEIIIEATGMTRSEIHGVVLNGSDVVTTDAVLKVSSAAQTSVVVTMEAPTINTKDQTISQTLTNDAVIELPRDSRKVYSFLYLNSNITQAGTDGSLKVLGAQKVSRIMRRKDAVGVRFFDGKLLKRMVRNKGTRIPLSKGGLF